MGRVGEKWRIKEKVHALHSKLDMVVHETYLNSIAGSFNFSKDRGHFVAIFRIVDRHETRNIDDLTTAYRRHVMFYSKIVLVGAAMRRRREEIREVILQNFDNRVSIFVDERRKCGSSQSVEWSGPMLKEEIRNSQ